MRISRPSPAMVVAIIALVVACAGSATAASIVIIKNSSQVRASSLRGSDVKARSLTNRTLANGAVNSRTIKKGAVGTDQLATSVRSALGGQGLNATESIRKEGPSVPNGGRAVVATLRGLTPGTYALTAKVVVSPLDPSGGILGELLKSAKTANARCTLDAAGDSDDAAVPIGTPFALYANTLSMQLTRTLATTSDVTLTCDTNAAWKAGNTSILALKLAGASRVDSTG